MSGKSRLVLCYYKANLKAQDFSSFMVSFGKCFIITTLGGTEDNTVWKNVDLNDRVETESTQKSQI